MKLHNYQTFINESTTMRDYFLKNPAKLKSIAINLTKKVKPEFDLYETDLAKEMFGVNQRLEDEVNSLTDKFIKQYPELKQTKRGLARLSYNTILKKEHDFSYSELYNNPSAYKDCLLLTKKCEVLQNYYYNKLEKYATSKGFSVSTISEAFKWILQFTSGSHQSLPIEVYNILHEVTVVPADLPTYVYRGFFYDGTKIKDVKAFLDKWAVGAIPKENLKKATSWSTSLGVAENFAGPDDKVKDSSAGYSIILRWKVKEDGVVADLRTIPDSPFYNQTEIIVNPTVKDYEVYKILSYKEIQAGQDLIANSTFSPFASINGISKTEMLQNPFNYYGYNVSAVDREKLKEFMVLTIPEIKKKSGFDIPYFPTGISVNAAVMTKIQPDKMCITLWNLVSKMLRYRFNIKESNIINKTNCVLNNVVLGVGGWMNTDIIGDAKYKNTNILADPTWSKDIEHIITVDIDISLPLVKPNIVQCTIKLNNIRVDGQDNDNPDINTLLTNCINYILKYKILTLNII